VKGSWLQVLFIVGAALAVHGFVRMAMTAEQRRVCTPICRLAPNYTGLNRLAPDFELPTLDGPTVRLSDYRGKVVVLNFWTRTCKPCREEMPSLAELAHVARDSGNFVVITVNTDDTPESAREILQALLGETPPFTVALDPDREIVTDQYGTRLLPETWFIDEQGVIRARFDGQRDWSDPMVLDFVESLSGITPCRIELMEGTPVGGPAWLCGEGFTQQ
jgi:thiol-disulfide isomerase/thioredoxin